MSVFIIALIAISLIQLSHTQITQTFVTKPVDTKVTIGSTALLKCSVSTRHGDVQWIHEGTALGYDRKVPGKPRYSVIWTENDDTEYHLQISNVTLEDEGLFSCQVAPIGDWDTKLEARAKLTVLVAPINGPEMMFNDESKNHNDIVHFRSMSLKSTKFTCTIRKSKPVSIIKWFINGSLANINVGKAVETKQSDGILDDLTSVFELKQQTNLLYNNSMIRCQAFHESYGLTTEIHNMSISLRVIVVYPPSVPLITGYENSTGIIAGSELKLSCSSTHTYPSAMLSWYRDGKLVSKNYDTIESTKTTESIYRIAKIAPSDNKAVFKCNSINQAMDDPFSTNITINVFYGPDKLTMNGVFEVEVGKQISAICFSDLANPAPRLRYNLDGIDYEPNTFAATSNPAGAFIVNGTFNQIVKQEHNNKELKCYVENKAAKIQQIVTKQIKVLYAPDSIEMTHSLENKVLNEGTKVRIVCVSRGGNPLPDIEWMLDSKTKLQPVSTQSIVYTVESVLDIVLTREHHNKVMECKSVNKVGTIKKQVSFNVSYLPTDVSISMVEPILAVNQTVKAGTKVVFSCRSPNSNPQPFITWFKDSYPVLINSDEQQNLTSKFVNDKEYETVSYMSFIASSSDHLKEMRCDVKVRDIPRTMHGALTLDIKFAPEIVKYPASIIDMNENASFSLNLTSRANPAPSYKCIASNNKKYAVVNSTLSFVTNRTDNGDFTCSISNSENQTDIKFKLNIKYSPAVRINSTLYTTTSGNKIQLFCLIDANPLLSNHITWKSNNKPLLNTDGEQYTFKFIPPNLSVLTINSARDIDDGNISCLVSNGIGKPDAGFTELRVKRIPMVLTDISVLKAGEDSNMGRNAVFKCISKAFPDALYKWKTPSNADITNSTKYVISNYKMDAQTHVSMLNIYSITSSDYGAYLCEARNEIGSTMAKAVLGGKHQPEQPSDFRVVNITRNAISLAWKKNFDGGEAQKFRIRYRKDTMDPTYKYIETENDVTSVTLDNLETATRYVLNIQSLNKFGTEGFLREPLIVQTDFGFNEVNQLPIFTGNDFPLTIILIICGSGILFMLFNIAFIIYLIKKRKRKGEADSTTDTNETEANTVEMFSPPPPYPDELNYQLDLNGNFEDENKPFVPHMSIGNHHPQQLSSKYFKDLNDRIDYAIEYATPIHQSWQSEQNEMEDDIYLSSLRQLDKNIAAAIAGVSAGGRSSLNMHPSTANSTIRSTFNPAHRLSFVNRPFGAATSSSYHQNLNSLSSSFADNYQFDSRAFPYDRLSQSKLASINSNKKLNLPITSTQTSNSINNNYRPNSSCKIYQDLDTEMRGNFEDLKGHLNNEFKGHLV